MLQLPPPTAVITYLSASMFPLPPFLSWSVWPKHSIHLEFSLLSHSDTTKRCHLSEAKLGTLWKPAARGAGGQTDSRGRRAAYPTIPPALHQDRERSLGTSTGASFASGGWNRFFAPWLQATRCAANCSSFGGRNQTELSSFEEKNHSFSVSETVSKCLQCSSPPACSSGFELDFPDNLDASTNYLAKAGLLAGGLLPWQFRV